jgi:pimeloyl-ACP methyl ester carboxylesterase
MLRPMEFVPAHLVVEAEGAAPTRTAFVLHGILGSAKNWRTFARRMAGRWPEWRLVLVDLRNHGESAGAPPPHTLGACARDLAALSRALGAWPEAVMGHSFGGKVALVYGRDVAPPSLRHLWVLDAVPGPAGPAVDPTHEVAQVIADLRAVGRPIASRDALVAHIRSRGYSQEIAGWMTTNLRRVEGGFDWRFDLDAIEEMLRDYGREDLWPWLAEPGPPVDVVRAGRSDRWTSDAIHRLEGLPRVRVHTLPNAGHWVHIDDPEGLLDVLGAGFGGGA